MTFLDYVVLIVVVVSTGAGATRGILKGTISVIAVLVGLITAVYLYRYAAWICRLIVESPRLAELLGFIGVFLTVVIAAAFISFRLRRKIQGTPFGWIDHALGAIFGLLRGWLICSVVYLALTAFPVKLEAVEQSRFAPVLLEGTRFIAYLTSSELRQRFLDGYSKIEQLWNEPKK